MNPRNYHETGAGLLVMITGPTAVGKTALAVELAKRWDSVILSCDSRQFYREMSIGTAKPTKAEREAVPHYFIDTLSVHDYYSVAAYESDVMALLPALFREYPVVFLAGGSGLYMDAVCKGIDAFPDPDPELRACLKGVLADDGLPRLQELLLQHDPDYYGTVDLMNPARLIRALEVSMTAGRPYSSMRTTEGRKRDFSILKICLNLPREELFSRISKRVDNMMNEGLEEEARKLLPLRHLTALQTVGYRELFDYMDGKCTLEEAVENIKTNTRRYAKRQLTWFRRDASMQWFDPSQAEEIRDRITQSLTS